MVWVCILALLLVTIPVEFVGPILAQEEESTVAPDPKASASDEPGDKGEDLNAKLKKAEEELRANRTANEERFKQLSQENDALKYRLGKAEEGGKAAKTMSEEQLVQLRKENDVLREKLGEVESREKATRVNIEEMSDFFKEELAQTRAHAEVMDREKKVVADASRNLKDQYEKSPAQGDGPGESAEESVLPQDGRLDELLKENTTLMEKSSRAEAERERDPSASEELDSLKAELAGTRAQFEALDHEKMVIADTAVGLQEQLEKSGEDLKITIALNHARFEELLKENDGLKEKSSRAIVASEEVVALKSELAKVRTQLAAADQERKTGEEASQDLLDRLKKVEEDFKTDIVANEERFQSLLKESNTLMEKLNRMESVHPGTPAVPTETDPVRLELSKTQAQLEVLNQQKAREQETDSDSQNRPVPVEEDFKLAVESLPPEERVQALLKENHALKQKLEQVEDHYQPYSSGSGETDATQSDIQQEPPAKPEKIGSEAPVFVEDPLRKLETELKSAIASNDERMQRLTRENSALRGELDEIDAKLIEAVKLRGVIRRSNTPFSDADRSKKPVESVQVIVPAGKVVLVRGSGNFVIIQFPHGNIPAANSKVNVYREGVHVGTAKITPPINPPLASADVLTGTLQQGDEVRQEP